MAGIRDGSMGNVLLLFPPLLFHDVKSTQKKLAVFEKVTVLNSNAE